MTRRFNCSFGVVISASHNLYDDNGIKFFDAAGGKLSDELEERIETELAPQPDHPRPPRSLGRATRADRSRTLYQEFCASTLPSGIELSGIEDRHRLRQRRRLQGGAAHPRRSRCRDRADRLLAQRPQHQRRLRLDRPGSAAAHGARRACQRRAGARRRRRPPGDGRSPRPDRRRRSAAVRARARPQAGRHALRAGGRHRR